MISIYDLDNEREHVTFKGVVPGSGMLISVFQLLTLSS